MTNLKYGKDCEYKQGIDFPPPVYEQRQDGREFKRLQSKAPT